MIQKWCIYYEGATALKCFGLVNLYQDFKMVTPEIFLHRNINESLYEHKMLYFDLRPGPKILFQGDTPEGSDTFQWPVIERDRSGRIKAYDIGQGEGSIVPLIVMHWKRVTSELTAWQLFPLDDN